MSPSALSPFRNATALGAVALSWIAFVWLWPPAYLTLPVDDAFYYFQIARNVAEGMGSTFDGVQGTNGYHPLWLAVVVPFAALPGDAAPVRAILTLQVLLVAGGGWWLARRLPTHLGRAFLVLLTLALLPFHLTKIVVNGQESALQWLLLCVAIGHLARTPPLRSRAEGLRRGLAIGGLGSLLVLARLDAIAFAGFAALLPVLWPLPSSSRRAGRSASLAALAVLGATAAIYALGNTYAFGHPLPVSAVLQAEADGATPVGAAAAAIVAVAIGTALCRLGARLPASTAVLTFRAALPLLVYATFLVGSRLSGGWHWMLRIWYLPPLLLLGLLAAAALATGSRFRVVIPLAAIALLAIAAVSWRHRLDPASYSTYLGARDTGRWIRARLPEKSRIAGWDVGIVAWHAGGGIRNLEGLAASWDYRHEILKPGRVDEHVRRSITHLVQPFPEPFLAAPPYRYEGVDLAEWVPVRLDCRRFRAALPGAPTFLRVHAVLEHPSAGGIGLAARAGDFAGDGNRPCKVGGLE